MITGIFGLGLEKRSILVQLQNQTKKRFSYCLPSVERPTSLRFGDNANIRGPRSKIQTTSLVPNVGNYYVAQMLGISIEEKRLNINPDLFRLKNDMTGGFGVDSGSPYSFIVETAFRTLIEEMVSFFVKRNGLNPIRQRMGSFELCYNMTRRSYVLPSLTFHFQGANLVMKPEAVFQSFDTVRCLAILTIDDRGPRLLGAFQQINYRFLFDGGLFKLSFAPENCD